MNAYEQMKNRFMVELDAIAPNLLNDYYNAISIALDKASSQYDMSVKETSLVVQNDTTPSLVKTYLIIKKTEGLSDGTLDNYAYILKRFFVWINKHPEDVTANDIRMFIYDYKVSHDITDRTLDKYREYICWFFNWAHAEEYIQRNPAKSIKGIRHETKERQALTQIELEYLRLACKTLRDKAILEFLYSTGCRVSELITVKKSDVDWKQNSVHLFGKGRKHRTSYVNAKCEVALSEYLKSRDDDSDYLFVSERKPYKKLSKCAVELALHKMANRSSVEKKITPHIIRHTTATQAVNNGMAIEEVSKLLGHANVATTMIYAQVTQNNIKTHHTKCVV